MANQAAGDEAWRGRVLLRSGLSLALVLLYVVAARADVRILASPGGDAGKFLELFSLIERTGERVVIDGPCYSACTLLLSVVPQNRICVTPKAVFGFHAARLMDQEGRVYPAPQGTRLMASTYPTSIRAWIERRGGLTSKPIFLRGRELLAFYPRCSSAGPNAKRNIRSRSGSP